MKKSELKQTLLEAQNAANIAKETLYTKLNNKNVLVDVYNIAICIGEELFELTDAKIRDIIMNDIYNLLINSNGGVYTIDRTLFVPEHESINIYGEVTPILRAKKGYDAGNIQIVFENGAERDYTIGKDYLELDLTINGKSYKKIVKANKETNDLEYSAYEYNQETNDYELLLNVSDSVQACDSLVYLLNRDIANEEIEYLFPEFCEDPSFIRTK